MDPLTRILDFVRTGAPLIAELRLGQNVSLGLPHLPGIPFHYVARGSCRIALKTEVIVLRAGDFVMLPGWPDYRLETGTGRRRSEIGEFAETEGLPDNFFDLGVGRPLITVVGSPRTASRLVSGIVRLAGWKGDPVTRELSAITLFRGVDGELGLWLAAAARFVSAEGAVTGPGFGAVAERLIELIFVASMRQVLLRGARAKGSVRRLGDPTISRALDAMYAEPARQWTLRELAALSGRSRSGFAEHFRGIMGMTPFAYLGRRRMELAASLVIDRRRSIAEVGASLGYRSPRGFSRAFIERFGESPTQYRRHRALHH